MKKLLICVLASLATASSIAQMSRPAEVRIVPEVRQHQNMPDPEGVEMCRRAHEKLESYVSKLNAVVYNMQGNPSSGYYVTYDVWQAIRVELMNASQPVLNTINKLSYSGAGAACIENANAGMVLMRDIVEQNISFRRIDASK